jgi:hypothetical protein
MINNEVLKPFFPVWNEILNQKKLPVYLDFFGQTQASGIKGLTIKSAICFSLL